MSNALMWKGLEAMALALIICPDPITTVVGISILSYARKKEVREKQANQQQQNRRHYFTDFYNCKVNMVRGSAITYRAATTRDGQLPLKRSTISRLYESRRDWEIFHKTVTARMPVPSITRHVPGQPTGYLKTPFVRYQTGLMPRRVEP